MARSKKENITNLEADLLFKRHQMDQFSYNSIVNLFGIKIATVVAIWIGISTILIGFLAIFTSIFKSFLNKFFLIYFLIDKIFILIIIVTAIFLYLIYKYKNEREAILENIRKRYRTRVKLIKEKYKKNEDMNYLFTKDKHLSWIEHKTFNK